MTQQTWSMMVRFLRHNCQPLLLPLALRRLATAVLWRLRKPHPRHPVVCLLHRPRGHQRMLRSHGGLCLCLRLHHRAMQLCRGTCGTHCTHPDRHGSTHVTAESACAHVQRAGYERLPACLWGRAAREEALCSAGTARGACTGTLQCPRRRCTCVLRCRWRPLGQVPGNIITHHAHHDDTTTNRRARVNRRSLPAHPPNECLRT